MTWPSLLNVCLLSMLAVAANLPSAVVQEMNGPIESGSTFPFNESATALNVNPLNKLDIMCLNGRDDPPAKYEQCEKAAAHISQSRERFDFVNRDAPGAVQDVIKMPINYFNDDASCVVRFSLRPEELGRTDFFIVRETAYAVLHECVKSRKQGGVAVGFTNHGHFAVKIESYKDPGISCDRSELEAFASCSEAANMMPAGYRKILFGDAGATVVAVPLPWSSTSSDGKCTITVENSGPATEATWDDLWTAVTAVNAKCPRAQRKGGKATKLGDSGKLSVRVSSGPATPRLGRPGTSITTTQNTTGNGSDGFAATA